MSVIFTLLAKSRISVQDHRPHSQRFPRLARLYLAGSNTSPLEPSYRQPSPHCPASKSSENVLKNPAFVFLENYNRHLFQQNCFSVLCVSSLPFLSAVQLYFPIFTPHFACNSTDTSLGFFFFFVRLSLFIYQLSRSSVNLFTEYI